MDFISFGLRVKLTFILGISNLVGLFLVLLSCRCMMKADWIKKLQQYSWYNKFYQWHCAYWWFFMASVFFHALIAIYTYGVTI